MISQGTCFTYAQVYRGRAQLFDDLADRLWEQTWWSQSETARMISRQSLIKAVEFEALAEGPAWKRWFKTLDQGVLK